MPTPKIQNPIKRPLHQGLTAASYPPTDFGYGSCPASRDEGELLTQWAWVDVNQIVPFAAGPRLRRNPKWDQIKAAIMASGGLTAPLSVTRRPNDDVYTCHQGGNTRLLILQDLFRETKDPRFAKTCVHVVPYENDFDLAVLHDRENTCRGNLAYIEEAWSKYRLYEIYAGRTEAKPTIRRFIADMARDHGIALSVEAFSRMRYTVEVLYQHIPACLVHGGMSQKSVRRLISIRGALKKAWRDRELGSDKIFDQAFYGLLERQDKALAEAFLDSHDVAAIGPNPRIVINWKHFLQDMQHEFAVAGEVDYQTASGWVATACRALPFQCDPGNARISGGAMRSSRSEISVSADYSLKSLRLAAFEQARDLVDLADLSHLVEPRHDGAGYALKAAPGPDANPMAKACWWALVLSSTSADVVSQYASSREEAPSFVHMSSAALMALSKLLATQARIVEQEKKNEPSQSCGALPCGVVLRGDRGRSQ